MGSGFFSGSPRRLYKHYLIAGALLALLAVGVAALVSPILILIVILFWPSVLGMALARLRCPHCGEALLSGKAGAFGPRILASWPTLPKRCPRCDAPVE